MSLFIQKYIIKMHIYYTIIKQKMYFRDDFIQKYN
jgi:hypothetical protein